MYGELKENGTVGTLELNTSDFISVIPGQTYFKTGSGSARFKFYYKDKTPYSTDTWGDIENASNAQSFIIPEGVYYIRCSVNGNFLNTLQIEQNTVATAYEDYVEDKIFILNDNNVYEEFDKKVYKEIEIGIEFETDEKFNGKAIYKKIIDFGTMPNNTSKSVAHNITNGDKILDVSIFCNNANGSFGGLVFPHIASSGQFMEVQITSQNVFISCNKNMSNFNALVTIYYTKK